MVTINPEWKAQELEYALKQSDTKVLVMQRYFAKESGDQAFKYDYLEILKKVVPEIENCEQGNLRLEELPELKSVILVSAKKEKGVLGWDA